MAFIDYDVEELFAEVREKAEAEGVTDREGWKDIIDDVLTVHAEFGELDEDELMELKEQLVARFKSPDGDNDEA